MVMYNPKTEPNPDIESFEAPSDTVFKLDLDLTKAIRLTPKILTNETITKMLTTRLTYPLPEAT